jgi:ubiquinone/menaquinone biosynthesis C-methylase UbiE
MFSDPQKNIEQAQIPLGATVADLGSGSGHYARVLSKAVGDNGKVYAVDIQKDLLTKLKNETTKEKMSNIEVVWGDVEKEKGTKLKDQSLDAVVISNLLFQIEDADAVAKETQRIVKKGGVVVIIDWSDSFGGLGPEQSKVVDKTKAANFFSSRGFLFEREIDTGNHHYGIIMRKV